MDIAKLALEDGTVFTGTAFGARGEVDGEVVFNTSMTGYQEILTDPSYHGQIVAMTYPQIGNYGVNDDDAESRRPWVRGFVVRELSGRVSNFRAAGSLETTSSGTASSAIEGIDTRALVRLTRERGAHEGHPLDDRPRRRQPGGQGQGQPRAWSAATWRARSCPRASSTWEPRAGRDVSHVAPGGSRRSADPPDRRAAGRTSSRSTSG